MQSALDSASYISCAAGSAEARSSPTAFWFRTTATRTPASGWRCCTAPTTGFKVAEYDLKVRGPGDFLGKRQHGLPQLKIADLGSSMEMMEQVQQAAELLLEPNRCSEAERNLLDEAIRRTLQTVGDSPKLIVTFPF